MGGLRKNKSRILFLSPKFRISLSPKKFRNMDENVLGSTISVKITLTKQISDAFAGDQSLPSLLYLIGSNSL